MRSTLVLLSCLLLLPSAALAGPDVLDLDLPEQRGSVESSEAKMKTARALHPPSKWLGLALVTPLGVSGISLTASSTIALGIGDTTGHGIMRPTGMGLMTGGLAA